MLRKFQYKPISDSSKYIGGFGNFDKTVSVCMLFLVLLTVFVTLSSSFDDNSEVACALVALASAS